jgi:hypothetical protein
VQQLPPASLLVLQVVHLSNVSSLSSLSFWRVEWRILRCSWRHALLLLAAQALTMLSSDRAILIMRVIPQEKVDGAVTLTSSIPWWRSACSCSGFERA